MGSTRWSSTTTRRCRRTSPARWRSSAPIRHVTGADHRRLRELRLRALAEDPEAFRSTHAEEAALPGARWEEWAAESEAGERQRTFVDADWTALALVRRADGAAVINAMWVAPEARGRGLLGELCEACAGWARQRGCGKLELGVMDGNDRALRAYERAGFAMRGREGDERVMVRNL